MRGHFYPHTVGPSWGVCPPGVCSTSNCPLGVCSTSNCPLGVCSTSNCPWVCAPLGVCMGAVLPPGRVAGRGHLARLQRFMAPLHPRISHTPLCQSNRPQGLAYAQIVCRQTWAKVPGLWHIFPSAQIPSRTLPMFRFASTFEEAVWWFSTCRTPAAQIFKTTRNGLPT